MTGDDVMWSYVLAAGRGVLIPAVLARDLVRRYATRGRSGVGTVVVVDAAVFLVCEERAGWCLYRLPMLAWWALLPGHAHRFVHVRVREGVVVVCMFCGQQRSDAAVLR